MAALISVRFLASQYPTGQKHGGRIDSLGVDENNCPVILEYKRHQNENVINQGLFYLDWLLDHKAEFEQLVHRRLGADVDVDWSAPRVLCIASDFTRYDTHAVGQINRNIELIRYRLYGGDLLLLELVNPPAVSNARATSVTAAATSDARNTLDRASSETTGVFEALHNTILALGDDVQFTELKKYFAYKRLQNFACVVPRRHELVVYLRLDPATVSLEDGFSKDMSGIGHYGTGDLEIRVASLSDVEKASQLITRSYEGR